MTLGASQWVLRLVLVGSLVAWFGCNQSEEVGKNSEMGNVAQAIKKPPAPPPTPVTAPAPADQPAARPVETAPAPQPAPPPTPAPAASGQQPGQPGQLEVVTAHSPQKGRSLQGGGYLSVVTGTRFFAEHQLILDNIRHAMDLYRAEHDAYPKTQEDFMRDIIGANMIQLPEPPPGYSYVYDPQEPLVLKMRNDGSGDPQAVE